MPITVVMPRLGWTMEAGTVVEWLKESGEPVEAGETLFSVESDKAITEVEALDSGVLYLPPDAPIGTEVPVGATVGYILAPGEQPPASTEITNEAAGLSSPSIGRGPGGEGAVLPSPGIGRGAGGEGPVSPRARRIAAELNVDLGGITGTGRFGRIREMDVRAAARAASNGGKPRVSPTVRRMAEEAGLDLALVESSGPAGRVTRADLRAATVAASPEAAGVPMTAFRRAISQRMAESAQSVAAVTLTTEVDATKLARVRDSLKTELTSAADIIPSYNDLLIRIVSQALLLHPQVNASLDGDRLAYHEMAHIGLAVDTERGLLVPVVRAAHRLGVFQIAAETARLIAATRSGSITRDEMSGGTFTITNLGMFDIDAFTPIINLPEAAVLGVGRIVPKPFVIDESTGEIGVRKMMALSLTFDHRVVDGAPAARFLQSVKQMVEQPMRWLL